MLALASIAIANAGTPVAFGQLRLADARAHNVEPVGHVGGSVQVVEIRGGYAYVGQAGRLVIVDVSDPARPRVVGKSTPLGYEVRQIELAGEYAHLAVVADTGLKNGGIRVLRISDPANPVDVGFYPVPENRSPRLVLMGSHGYVTAGTISRGWDLIDFSDPANPKEVAKSVLPDGLAVHADRYVYVYGPRPTGLKVFDGSDPANPDLVGTLDDPSPGKTLSLLGTTLYLMSDDKRLQAIDVSDPMAPRVASETSYQCTAAAHVAISGGRAYLLVVEDRMLKLLDITDPATPVELGSSRAWTGPPQSAAVDGTMVYIAAAGAGLRVHALDGAKQMPEVGALDGPGYGTGTSSVALAGAYAYVADGSNGVHVVRVDDPARPIHVGVYRSGGEAIRVAASGSHAYVLERPLNADRPGLRVLDVSDPSRPTSVGMVGSLGFSQDLAVAGSHAYVVASGQVHIVDVSDPSRPTRVGGFVPPLDPAAHRARSGRIAVAGSHAYVASASLEPQRGGASPKPVAAESGLRVVDVSNPLTPVEVGFAPLAWEPDAVAVVGSYVYVVAHQLEGQPGSGLKVFDVSNPASPFEVAALPTGANLFGSSVSVAGRHAYVAGNGLHVLDVADPARPVEVGFYPGSVNSGAASGNLAYLGMGSDGLEIVRFTGGP